MEGKKNLVINISNLRCIAMAAFFGFLLVTFTVSSPSLADQGLGSVAFSDFDIEFDFELSGGEPIEMPFSFGFKFKDDRTQPANTFSSKQSRVSQLLLSLSIDVRGPPALS